MGSCRPALVRGIVSTDPAPVTPATILRRHRNLVAWKWTFTDGRRLGSALHPPAGRGEDPTWGHRRIQGELARLGYTIAASTVWEILHRTGVDPAPRRAGPSWRQFLTAQAHAIIACDFLVVETLLLKRLYVLVFIEHDTAAASGWGERAPERDVDGAASPQLGDGPGGAHHGPAVRDPRSGPALHCRLSGGHHSRRASDRHHSAADAEDERHLRAGHRHPAPRAV